MTRELPGRGTHSPVLWWKVLGWATETPWIFLFVYNLMQMCEDHNLSVNMSFWYATSKNNWSFQTILKKRQNIVLGGVLVALKLLMKGAKR